MSNLEEAAQHLRNASAKLIGEGLERITGAQVVMDEVQAMVNEAVGGTEMASESALVSAALLQQLEHCSQACSAYAHQLIDYGSRLMGR